MKRREILTELELLEIKKLQLLILQSTSIFKTNKYKKQIYEICKKAEERYRKNMGKNKLNSTLIVG